MLGPPSEPLIFAAPAALAGFAVAALDHLIDFFHLDTEQAGDCFERAEFRIISKQSHNRAPLTSLIYKEYN